MKQLYWILISAAFIISILGFAGVYGDSEVNKVMFQIWAVLTVSAVLMLLWTPPKKWK